MSSSSSSVGSGCWSTPPEYTKHRAQHWHGKVSCRDRFVVDAHGRTLSLRGVNVCANSKLPTSPPGSTHLSEGFWNHRHVSFIGRPFPLADADEHFARLRSWGLTFIRLLVPWEALGKKGKRVMSSSFFFGPFLAFWIYFDRAS